MFSVFSVKINEEKRILTLMKIHTRKITQVSGALVLGKVSSLGNGKYFSGFFFQNNIDESRFY